MNRKGGSAKGELILAIYELANCYRQGWGVPKDLAAAFQYYLTAANLGDTDAMNEVALCYLEGYGTKKNKVCGSVCFYFLTKFFHLPWWFRIEWVGTYSSTSDMHPPLTRIYLSLFFRWG